MSRLRSTISISIAAEFLRRSFDSRETIAILLRRVSPAVTVQRIVRFESALAPRYLGWLASENVAGANVYVAANPLRAGSRKRTKESVAAIRHLYLDLDTDADAKLAALRSSETVPVPTAIVSTSSGKYQVLLARGWIQLRATGKHAQVACNRLRWRSCLHRLQSRSSAARISESQVRSSTPGDCRISERFDLASR